MPEPTSRSAPLPGGASELCRVRFSGGEGLSYPSGLLSHGLRRIASRPGSHKALEPGSGKRQAGRAFPAPPVLRYRSSKHNFNSRTTRYRRGPRRLSMSRRFVPDPRWALASFRSLTLFGCSSGAFSARVDNGHGTVNIFLTDAPLDLAGVTSVNVTLTDVVLFPEDSDVAGALNAASDGGEMTPVVIVSHPATFDLLT